MRTTKTPRYPLGDWVKKVRFLTLRLKWQSLIPWNLSRGTTFLTRLHVHTAKTQISTGIRQLLSELFSVCRSDSKGSQMVLCTDLKTLIRLRECAGWFESSLGIHIRRYVFSRYESNDNLLSQEIGDDRFIMNGFTYTGILYHVFCLDFV